MTALFARTDQVAAPVFSLVQRIAAPLLRISLGIILLWIAALKFHNPSDVVGLLHKSVFSALASVTFVHVLGVLEIIAAVLLIGGFALRYVALVSLLLFVGTIIIFFTTPSVTGFPYLTVTGQFLLKDIVLAAALIMVAATDVAKHAAAHMAPTITAQDRTHVA